MKTSTKLKLLTATSGVLALAASGVYATPLIANDTLDGLPSMGTQIGGFLQNMSPGLFAFLLFLGLAGGIVAIIYAVFHRIRGGIGGHQVR